MASSAFIIGNKFLLDLLPGIVAQPPMGIARRMLGNSSGDLPPGLALHLDGELSGAPTTPGTFNFTATFEEDELSSGEYPVVVTRSFFITIRAQAG